MASIQHKGRVYYVIYVYRDSNGKQHQKWEPHSTFEEAIQRKAELDITKNHRKPISKRIRTMNELLDEYVELYGVNTWSVSVYGNNQRLIEHYIKPNLGSMSLKKVNARVLDVFYSNLLMTEAIPFNYEKKKNRNAGHDVRLVTPATVRKIHSLLRSVFNQALKWELIDRNPTISANPPKVETNERKIWDAETLFNAINLCQQPSLQLCMHLSFACSLRIGEILGLTWDCVDLSEESMKKRTPSVMIEKTIQRANKEAIIALNKRDIIKIFPESDPKYKTVVVLKKPKTASSVRRVFLPMSLAEMLIQWKKEQDERKQLLGDEYTDYDLVIPRPWGTPCDSCDIQQQFKALILDNGLPMVVFHSLRHTSITYKLKLNGGDIKAVQGDSGHSQAQMITERYSHVLDEGRVTNAMLIENAFYQRSANKDTTANVPTTNDSDITPELIQRLLQNEEAVSVLRALLQKYDNLSYN